MVKPRIAMLAGGALLAALAAAAPAAADESATVVGAYPGTACAAWAAAATAHGTVSPQGERDCSRELMSNILTRSERAAVYTDRGVVEEALGRHAEAIADFQRSLRLDPTSAGAHADLGVALQATGRPAEAVLEFSRAIELNPEQPAAVYFDRALANEDRGEMKAAYLDYLKASKLAPDWDQPKHELARFTVVRREAQG